MRLSVILGTQEQYDAAIPAPEAAAGAQPAAADVQAYYLEHLSQATTDTVDFRSVARQDPPSKSFALIGVVENAIMGWLREHESPAQVRIISTDEEVARLYKVVYNFNFADSKAARMADDHWD